MKPWIIYDISSKRSQLNFCVHHNIFLEQEKRPRTHGWTKIHGWRLIRNQANDIAGPFVFSRLR